MTVGLADAERPLTVAVQPPAFERLSVETGAPVEVVVPPDAVHLIARSPGSGQ